MIRNQLLRNHVDILGGTARFENDHMVTVQGESRGDHTTVTAANIATGTRPARPSQVEFDDNHVIDSDAVLRMRRVPSSLVVAGAGVIGIEYASMFAALGIRVTVVERQPQMLSFCDPEVVESLKFHLRDQAVTFRCGAEVEKVEITPRGTVTSLASGKRIAADMVMYSARAVTEELDLQKAGLSADTRGRINVDGQYRTSGPHIFAVVDVIGFPALAATSMDQGRLAACHAFNKPVRELQVNAGSAVRATTAAVDAAGARVVALAALLVLGTTGRAGAIEQALPLDVLAERPNRIWERAACPRCARGEALEPI